MGNFSRWMQWEKVVNRPTVRPRSAANRQKSFQLLVISNKMQVSLPIKQNVCKVASPDASGPSAKLPAELFGYELRHPDTLVCLLLCHRGGLLVAVMPLQSIVPVAQSSATLAVGHAVGPTEIIACQRRRFLPQPLAGKRPN